MKHQLTTSLLWLIAALLAGCGKPRQTLNILVYPDFLPPSVILEFEQKFNCTITKDPFESPDAVIAKLAGGGSAVYDVVLVLGPDILPMAQRGLLAPLRHAAIPNLQNVDPRFLDTEMDPGNLFGAPSPDPSVILRSS